VNPDQDKTQPKTDQKPKNTAEKKKTGKPPEDARSKLDPVAQDANHWGDLPAKLHDDAAKAKDRKVPERFREAFEKYGEELSK
jgi:hypothetical protein